MRELVSEIETRLDGGTAKALAHAVTRGVRDGALQPGDRLPPIRELARELALSPTTVSSAWRVLAAAGTLVTAGRRGTVVADVASPREGRYRRVLDRQVAFETDLSTGVPDKALLPNLGPAFRELDSAGTPASYLDDPVLPRLREHLMGSWPHPPPAMTVVDGAMDGLELLIRSQLSFGDRVLVENPTFPPLLDLLEAAGLIVEGVALDESGMVPDDLSRALIDPARAVFLQPRAHNPTGVCMSAARLQELSEILAPADVLVVEDDSAAAISSASDVSFGSTLPERTVHIRSFSKSHGPDLRLAAMSGPADLIASVQHLRQLGQGWSSRLLQRILVNLLDDPAAQARVEAATHEYARRRREFTAVLADAGIPTMGSDGLNVWVPVHDETAAAMRLAVHGIAVAPGRPFGVGPSAQAHVRVTTGLITADVTAIAELVVLASRTSARAALTR